MTSVRKLYEAKSRPTSDPKKTLEQAWLLWAEGNDEVFSGNDEQIPQQFEDAVDLLNSLDIGRGDKERLKGSLRSAPMQAAHFMNVFMRGIARKLGVRWGSNDYPPAELYEAKSRPAKGVELSEPVDIYTLRDILDFGVDHPDALPIVRELYDDLWERSGEAIDDDEPLLLTDDEAEKIVRLTTFQYEDIKSDRLRFLRRALGR